MSIDTYIRDTVMRGLERNNGILRLQPTWVARDFLKSGRNFGLKENEYNLGERGEIVERWLGSTTRAMTDKGPQDEGLSYVEIEEGYSITLSSAVDNALDLIAGPAYALTHAGLGRLAKIFNFGDRLFYHYHQMQKDADLIDASAKEEAYYFPPRVALGPHPETFFGVHPYIVDQEDYDILLPHLVEWKDDLILRHARAYMQMPDDGFHVPAGILHAPGTAVTIELQEPSDVFSNLQAVVGGKLVSKNLLYHSVRAEDRDKYGERVILGQLDWPLNGDPYFYENRHTPPVLIAGSQSAAGEEYWIYYNTRKFSGKKLIVHPGQTYITRDRGCYNILVWEGKGRFDGHPVEAGNFHCDEYLVTHEKAAQPLQVENTGVTDLMIFKFFGPDINLDVPMLPVYRR